MNNITFVKVMDDKVIAFVPEYSDSSIQLYSILIQFIILLYYQITDTYRTARICEHTNTGAAAYRTSKNKENTDKMS
jgi:hypothetical protein